MDKIAVKLKGWVSVLKIAVLKPDHERLIRKPALTAFFCIMAAGVLSAAWPASEISVGPDILWEREA